MKPIEILEKFKNQIPGFLGAAVGFGEEDPALLHGDTVFPAASIIKIPILIYLLSEKEKNHLDLKEIVPLKNSDKVGGSGILLELHEGTPLTLLDLATLMIVVSDNTATNLLMDRLETKKIQAMIGSLGLSHTVLGRKMMVAPDAPPANFTTPLETFLLFKKLLIGELLSQENTQLAIDILFRQQYNEKIPALLPKDVKVGHKTGEITGIRHDCGIIRSQDQDLILCLFTKDISDEWRTDRVLAELSRALYEHYMKGMNP